MSIHEEPGPSPTADLEKASAPAPIAMPEGGLNGWMSVASLFLFNCATWASNSAYAVYLAHYLQYDTYPSATKLDYAAIGGIAFGGGLICAPLVRVVHRYAGLKICISIGAVLQFLGIMLAAFSTQLWEIYMTQGVLMGFSLALITMPSMTIVPQWFRKRRSLAMAISAAGSGAGGMVFNLALQAIISKHGLKWAFIVQAICCCSCTIVGMLLARTREKEIQTSVAIWDWHMLGYMSYWLMIFFVCFTLLGYVVLMYNLADFTISLGYTAYQGSIVSCMIAVGIIFGRPLMGKLSDMYGPVTTCMFANGLVGVLSLAMWIPARNYATAIAFAFIVGGTMGTIWVVIAPLAARLVGLRRIDVAMGMMWVPVGASGLVSPLIGIKLRSDLPPGVETDPEQYRNPAIWCGMVYFGSVLVLWLIRAYLIARDRQAEKMSSHEDNDELHIKVHWKDWLRAMLTLSKTRNI